MRSDKHCEVNDFTFRQLHSRLSFQQNVAPIGAWVVWVVELLDKYILRNWHQRLHGDIFLNYMWEKKVGETTKTGKKCPTASFCLENQTFFISNVQFHTCVSAWGRKKKREVYYLSSFAHFCSSFLFVFLFLSFIPSTFPNSLPNVWLCCIYTGKRLSYFDMT